MKKNNNDAKSNNKNKAVLDISALMALFTGVTYSENMYELMENAAVSVICISEIMHKAEQAGLSSDFIIEQLQILKLDIIPFDLEQAQIDCNLKIQKKNFSFADRASIALALQLKLPIYSANKNLSSLLLSVPVHLI